jgi:ABC-type phosphate transport system substrate-binding protein
MHAKTSLPERQRHMLRVGLACILIAGAKLACAGDVVVIAGSGSAVGSMTKEQVADLFLGRTTSLPGGGGAQLIDQPESSPLRDTFYSKVTGKSASQVKSTWAKLSFTGKGTPPKEGASNDDVKKQVAGSKTALGYIDKGAVDGSVKIVFTP